MRTQKNAIRVVLLHPGLQHASKAAEALYQHNRLAKLVSGIPLFESGENSRLVKSARIIARETTIPRELRCHPIIFPVMRKLLVKSLPSFLRRSVSPIVDVLFDYWCALFFLWHKPTVVIGYETACLKVFKKAKKAGILCILDAASVHYSACRIWSKEDHESDPGWVEKRKSSEIKLCDYIICCSSFAGQSYLEGGVERSKVKVVNLGANVGLLARASATRQSNKSPLRFVFVGSICKRKSVDILLQIFSELNCSGEIALLTLIGGSSDVELYNLAKSQKHIIVKGYMTQESLFKELQEQDCLLLVSRFDSFGMVVAEAMAVGVPALVTNKVGAKSIIEDTPNSGWIVDCSYECIKQGILSIIEDRASLERASAICRVAASKYTWDNYGKRLNEVVGSISAERLLDKCL